MGISKKQTSMLHVAKAKLSLSDAAYRELLQDVAGVTSSKHLDSAGFQAVIDRLAEMGFQTPRAHRTYGNRRGMATPDQVEYIRDLWQRYKGEPDPRGLDHWLERSFGVTALRFTDQNTAGKALVALKRMVSRAPPSR
ncbi:regulatory protein GemA [Aquisalimonas asiatica]|uniref:Mu-like prophage protein gp16 n=1 Tax=Aquisalimonas asiatica TaxID=406100 RepID=A0A1H8RSK9_9GAMM|nr:regulatory protein GemA [Aquisalimonas asiatica]SEO69342.1 Protein of unknown function [Aquisalimonas asiatica]